MLYYCHSINAYPIYTWSWGDGRLSNAHITLHFDQSMCEVSEAMHQHLWSMWEVSWWFALQWGVPLQTFYQTLVCMRQVQLLTWWLPVCSMTWAMATLSNCYPKCSLKENVDVLAWMPQTHVSCLFSWCWVHMLGHDLPCPIGCCLW